MLWRTNMNKNSIKKKLAHSTRTSLLDLTRKFQSNRLLLPDWQRDFVWDEKKIKGWFADLDVALEDTSEHDIPGVFLTYHIKDKDDVKFINDGGNRTRCTVKYLADRGFDVPKGIVEDALSRIYVHLQEWEYEDTNTAFMDFIRANIGVVSTPKEVGQGILANGLSNYKSFWQEYFERLGQIVDNSLSRMNCKLPDPKTKRVQSHKYIRDNYALFFRYISRDPKSSKYDAGVNSLTNFAFPDTAKLSDIIEAKLLTQLAAIKEGEAEKLLNDFKKLLDDEIAVYQKIWSEVVGEGFAPNATHLRWVLHLAIYRRNKGLLVDDYINFTQELIKRTSGKTAVYDTNSRKRTKSHANLGLSNLSVLTQIESLLETTIHHEPRKRNLKNLALGYDESHLTPFCEAGNGPTIPLPAIINNSRGRNVILTSDSIVLDQ